MVDAVPAVIVSHLFSRDTAGFGWLEQAGHVVEAEFVDVLDAELHGASPFGGRKVPGSQMRVEHKSGKLGLANSISELDAAVICG